MEAEVVRIRLSEPYHGWREAQYAVDGVKTPIFLIDEKASRLRYPDEREWIRYVERSARTVIAQCGTENSPKCEEGN